MAFVCNGLVRRGCHLTSSTQSCVNKRLFYSWLIEVFNRKDGQRAKEVGPDRVASEWMLRNGGKIKFSSSVNWMTQYGGLGGKGKNQHHVVAIDARGVSVTDSGLQHLIGLKHLQYLDLHGCGHITSLDHLKDVANTLEYLDISECRGLSDLTPVASLLKLQKLFVTGTLGGSNRAHVIETLKKTLPSCEITD